MAVVLLAGSGGGIANAEAKKDKGASNGVGNTVVQVGDVVPQPQPNGNGNGNANGNGNGNAYGKAKASGTASADVSPGASLGPPTPSP
jgi:hypothetical protein